MKNFLLIVVLSFCVWSCGDDDDDGDDNKKPTSSNSDNRYDNSKYQVNQDKNNKKLTQEDFVKISNLIIDIKKMRGLSLDSKFTYEDYAKLSEHDLFSLYFRILVIRDELSRKEIDSSYEIQRRVGYYHDDPLTVDIDDVVRRHLGK